MFSSAPPPPGGFGGGAPGGGFRDGGRGGRGGSRGGRPGRDGKPKSTVKGPPLTLLPPEFLPLFAPRPELRHIPTEEPLNAGSDGSKLTGVAAFVSMLDPSPALPAPREETKEERHARQRRAAREANEARIETELVKWNPRTDPQATRDPYRTLFVARLDYVTTERKLQREFEVYGPISRVRIVTDAAGLSRGYGFIEFSREEDMKAAWSRGDGKTIDSRRVLVDVERGRTVVGWRCRRLGGGFGNTRANKPKKGASKRDGWMLPGLREYWARRMDPDRLAAAVRSYLAGQRRRGVTLVSSSATSSTSTTETAQPVHGVGAPPTHVASSAMEDGE